MKTEIKGILKTGLTYSIFAKHQKEGHVAKGLYGTYKVVVSNGVKLWEVIE